ncbi:MAG: hypothetical protein D6730_23000 [Bacteroidetes bacterium]|nr:MAG: hypothetical protein D6730_23000 [Bacteroidota bacterium]
MANYLQRAKNKRLRKHFRSRFDFKNTKSKAGRQVSGVVFVNFAIGMHRKYICAFGNLYLHQPTWLC